jgi:hypothetical protein
MAHPGWLAVLLSAASALGQASPRLAPASRERAITFSDTKPVLGLPADGAREQGLCSSDGLSYFDPASDADGSSRVLDLYSVATSGEVRHLSRTVPVEFTNAYTRDFFPGDSLVTLIEAQKRDTSDPDARPREIQYYLYVSDHDGDGSELLPLDLHFKPLKVAQFGSGEFLVLGWEEANRLEELAILKEDGTVRRFVDLDAGTAGAQTRAAGSAGATLASLTGAAFVPFGKGVLLTFPGTVKPIRVLNAAGSDFSVSLEIPPGYELHDVLNSGGVTKIVARVEEIPTAQKGKAADGAPPRQRIFEFQAFSGRRLREFTFENVPVSAIRCAANNALAAIFEQPAGSAADANGGAQATQLVVGTVLR